MTAQSCEVEAAAHGSSRTYLYFFNQDREAIGEDAVSGSREVHFWPTPAMRFGNVIGEVNCPSQPFQANCCAAESRWSPRTCAAPSDETVTSIILSACGFAPRDGP